MASSLLSLYKHCRDLSQRIVGRQTIPGSNPEGIAQWLVELYSTLSVIEIGHLCPLPPSPTHPPLPSHYVGYTSIIVCCRVVILYLWISAPSQPPTPPHTSAIVCCRVVILYLSISLHSLTHFQPLPLHLPIACVQQLHVVWMLLLVSHRWTLQQ